eukprot:CAMPEP_0174700158 /NCGR_PEP_ID=MMETSP1094-20130205/5197_1 /TAXON_ID=156173 /ORGANISM="Chrysochromulina brevifilum, Strain UTEX LB 985" /LENGTH=399 /DNA_ID=CAMNT_0015897597 /DNA_START=161 /DNA_END=1360 /DNA_ORIENTATION=+
MPTEQALVAILVLLFTVLLTRWLRSGASPAAKNVGVVSEIIIYPLKSARGISVRTAKIGPRGLLFDRQWMVVDGNGAFLSQRRAPKLATIQVELPTSPKSPLCLSAEGAEDIVVPVLSSASDLRGAWEVRGYTQRQVRVWDDKFMAIDQGDEAAIWCSKVLGIENVRLVRLEDDYRRYCDSKYAPSGSHTSLADGFPLLLTSEASLAQVNEKLKARCKPVIPMERFRANLVIKASDTSEAGSLKPFDEDGWGHIKVFPRPTPEEEEDGKTPKPCIFPLVKPEEEEEEEDGKPCIFPVVKPCTRCKMPTIDQSTGLADCVAKPSAADDDEGGGPAAEAEPIATLRTFRTGELLGYTKASWQKEVFFGQNLCLDPNRHPGASISVGNRVSAAPKARKPSWL